MLKNIRDDNLITTLSFDLSKIIKYIANKKKDKGTDDDIKYRFEIMMRRISKYRRDVKMNKNTTLDLESKMNQNFFEFLTQANVPSTSNIANSIDNSPVRSTAGDSRPNTGRKLPGHNFSTRKESIKSSLQDEQVPMHQSSQSKKRSQFDVLYAYSEKDKTIEKLNFDEFLNISFTHPVPCLMIDFVKYLTGYDMYKVNLRVMNTPNFDNLEYELSKLKTAYGKSTYQDLVNGFLLLVANPEAVLDNLWYITQDSMHKKFASVFGEYNEYF